MKKILSLMASMAFTCVAMADDPVNTKCPYSAKDIDKAVTSDYKKEVSFCCEKCKGKFDKDPDSFIEKVASYDTKSGKCIFTGKAVNTAQKSTYTKVVAFCCDKCKPKFDKEPDKVIAKAVKK
jgi:YHS domain-containing protein